MIYAPERYAYMPGIGLVYALDEMVESGDFSNYQLLREHLEGRMRRLDRGNPFGAGRPVVYDEDDEDTVLHLKLHEHKTNREVAQIMKCSSSTVSRLYNKGLEKMRQKS